MVIVPITVGWDSCGVAVPADLASVATAPCGCGGDAFVVAACEEIACGAAVDCGGPVVAAPADDAETPPAPAEASVVTPPAAEPAPTPVAQVPDLEAVEPASATEPTAADAADSGLTIPADEPEPVEPEADVVGEDAAEMEVTEEAEPISEEPAPTEPPAAAPEPEPEPTNIFEEVEAAEVDESESVPFADPAAEEESAELPAAGDGVPAEESPVDAPVIEDVPALEPDSAEEPAVSPADEAAVEPLRRWIDASASFAVVGRLVAVQGGTIAIARSDGRHVTVPIAVLSDFDRDYVAVAGPRVAAGQGRHPQPSETASR